jgi:hypothetical protein
MITMLIHYKVNGETIKSVDANPVETLTLAKEVDYIHIDGETYKYAYSEFHPTFDDVYVDVLNIELRHVDYSM